MSKLTKAAIIVNDPGLEEKVLLFLKEHKIEAESLDEMAVVGNIEAYDLVFVEQLGSTGDQVVHALSLSKNLKIPCIFLGDDSKDFFKTYQSYNFCKFYKLPFEEAAFAKEFIHLAWDFDKKSHNHRHLTKGEYLIKEGEESDSMYWLLTGKLGVTKENDKGEQIQIAEILPGELIGEMGFIESQTRTATVKAIDESDVINISHQDFIQIFNRQPVWFRSLVRNLSNRLKKANQIISDDVKHTADEIELIQNDINDLIDKSFVKGV